MCFEAENIATETGVTAGDRSEGNKTAKRTPLFLTLSYDNSDFCKITKSDIFKTKCWQMCCGPENRSVEDSARRTDGPSKAWPLNSDAVWMRLNGSHGLRLFGSVEDHVFQLARVWHVVAGLVLGQDLHERTGNFSHHCSLGILWLNTQERSSHIITDMKYLILFDNTRTVVGTYTKSVSSLSWTTGWKTIARRRMPSKQAESSVLANTLPTQHTQI